MIAKNQKVCALSCINSFVAGGVAAALALMSLLSFAQGTSAFPRGSTQYVKGSLCMQPDQVIFSCPLARNGKIVSVCATGNTSSHQFYYAFGRQHSLEMRYPDSTSISNDEFSHAYLGYSGGKAGYAYSFVINEMKYIVYYLSGSYRYNAGGVIVQKPGSINALANMACEKGEIDVVSNRSMFDETSKWKIDDDLEAHGLPLTR